tara:strand:+ start:1588 stop:1776 length:189 start_codon:yes stop_codon:yes gene_type:complete
MEATELGGLPPEIFAMVIGHYVTKVGIRKAWKVRLVSSEFEQNSSEGPIMRLALPRYFFLEH